MTGIVQSLSTDMRAMRLAAENKQKRLDFEHSDVSLADLRDLARDRLQLSVEEGKLMVDYEDATPVSCPDL